MVDHGTDRHARMRHGGQYEGGGDGELDPRHAGQPPPIRDRQKGEDEGGEGQRYREGGGHTSRIGSCPPSLQPAATSSPPDARISRCRSGSAPTSFACRWSAFARATTATRTSTSRSSCSSTRA